LSGGISLLFSIGLESFISVEKRTKTSLWCRIDSTILDSTKDLFIYGVYIPPERSSYYDEEIFDDLENDIVYFSKKGNVMLLGDFNARTSKLEDFVSNKGNTFINDITETAFQPKIRESFDSYINKHGKNLIEICKNCNLRILNGRTLGDSFGKPTSHSKNGSSVVDYIICDQELTQSTENFIVKPPTYLSDHSQLVTWIKRASTHVSLSETAHTQQPKTHKSFQTQIQQKLQYLINSNPSPSKEGVDRFASKVEDVIMHAAKKSMKIKKKKYRNNISNVCNKKWFDKECRTPKTFIEKTCKPKTL
jgi:hypothetical protein